MGVEASKELSVTILQACTAAEQAGKQQLDETLSEIHITALRQFWLAIPAKLRNQINPRPNYAVQTITGSESSITISAAVRDKLSRWSSKIETFFEEDCIEQPRNGVHLIVNLLSCLFTLSRRATIDEIRWRISAVALFRIKSQISDRCRLSKDDERILLQLLTQLGVQPKYQADAVKWANIGKRYDSLASDMGGLGSLAALPSDITRDLWETSLPMSGESRTDSINLLKGKGVPEAAKEFWDTTNGRICANSAVESIVTGILSKVDADTIFDVQVVLGVQGVHINRAEKGNTHSRSSKRKKGGVPAQRGGRKRGRSRALASEYDGAENNCNVPVRETPTHDIRELEQPDQGLLQQMMAEEFLSDPGGLSHYLQQDLIQLWESMEHESWEQGSPPGLLNYMQEQGSTGY